MNDSLSIGETVRVRRKELGLTQFEAAELAGVSVRFVHDVENGKPTVQLDLVQALSEALGLSIRLVLRRPSS
jgi:y4mF family transcriptional regulator